MMFLLICLLSVILYQVLVKKDLQHPIIYFYGMFCLPLLFSILDVYESRITVSNLTIVILAVGFLGFGLGSISNIKFKVGNIKIVELNDSLEYSFIWIYVLLFISVVFNVFMTITTIMFLKRGYDYSSIRDLLFDYSGADTSYFKTTFYSTFYSWIATPSTYVISIVFLVDLFENKLNKFVKVIFFINIGLYIWATGSRLIILIMVIESFFLLQYYKIHVSKRVKKYVIRIGILMIIGMFILSSFRTKTNISQVRDVSSIYAYFNIPIPLLSYWTEQVNDKNIYGYGYGFFNGIMQFISYCFGKIGIEFQSYSKTAIQLYMPQEKWIQIYDGHWYNAFCTLFYNFYVDFRLPGVFIESYIFGIICKYFYRKACVLKEKIFLLTYLGVLQIIIASFLRWQFGAFTYIVTIIFTMLCVKKGKKNE